MTGSTPQAVVMASHFPPPVTGMSAVNARIAEELAARGAFKAKVSLSTGARGAVAKAAGRIGRLFAALGMLVSARRDGVRTFYMPADGRLGLWFNIVLGAAARALGYRAFIHHHSFAYINRRSRLMAWLLRVQPAGATHVFLCEDMSRRFQDLYPQAWRAQGSEAMVVGNGFMIEPQGEAPAPPVRTLGRMVIGHMSNLSRSKGSLAFIRLFEALVAAGEEIEAVIAGPIGEPEVDHAISAALTAHPDRFRYLGPVYGADKAAFFGMIDLFVFPTEYVNEAQPLVLLEALDHGRPIVSLARGCIACDFDQSVGVVLPDMAAFSADAAPWITELQGRPERLTALSANSREWAQEARAASLAQLDRLLDYMTRN